MTTIFVGDIGTELVLDCGVDISTATVRRIMAKDPRGVVHTWEGIAEGTTSIKYTVLSGDIDLTGAWKVQAYIEMPTWKGHGTQSSFNVTRIL